MKPKLFRDPVHNIIAFDLNDEAEALLFRLIRTQAFQRLRRIRQLGFANLIYHGAEHSRFAHSLGVAHVARRVVDALSRFIDISPARRAEVLCAALLHDIGHGPFSHAIEQVTGIHHESYSAQVVQDPDSDVFAVLRDVDPTLPARVARYFGPRSDFPSDQQIFLDVVSSQLDADRLDYILRDGLATGVKIGVFDFERILQMVEPYQGRRADGRASCRLAVSHRAREAVEGYLIARFHMFKQVYLHKAVRAAEKMLEAVLRRALVLQRDGHRFANTPSPALSKLLAGDRLSTHDYLSLDDTDVWMSLKSWRDDPDEVLSSLATGLLDRRLYKTVDLDPGDPVSIARTIDRAREVAKTRGLDPDFAVLPDRAGDMPYSPYNPEHGDVGAHIPIIGADGYARPIEESSDMVHLLGRDAYKVLRLCVPADLRPHL